MYIQLARHAIHSLTQSPAPPQSTSPASTTPVPPLPHSIYDNLQLFGRYSGFGNADFVSIIVRLIQTALSFVGIIFVVLIIVSGMQWMLSGGDDEKVAAAKKSLINALVGLILILLSYSIVLLVTSNFTSQSSVTQLV